MEFRVKKRPNDRINEVKKILKPVDFVPNQYGDRFIPRRYAQTSSSRFKAERTADGETDLMRMKERKAYWKSYAFTAVFQDVFGLNPDTAKILSFHDVTTQERCKKVGIRQPTETYLEPTYKNVQRMDWSCKLRSKPLAFIESVHDLPRIRMIYSNVIDWSAKNQFAALFSKRLVIWTPNNDATVTYNAPSATGVVFNPTGDQLILALYSIRSPILYLMDGFDRDGNSTVFKRKTYCLTAYQMITCLTFDSSGEYIACGTACGKILVLRLCDFGTTLRTPFQEVDVHEDRLSIVRFSPASQYLASSDESGHLYIWAWKKGCLSALTVWVSNSGRTLFDWHPWREDEIIIADTEPVTLALFHVRKRKVLSFHRRRNVDCVISALAFNKVSGELVVSYAYPVASQLPEMLVLGSMDRVVDVMGNYDDLIGNIMWSPDGMQMASASFDEALTIWNFFGVPPSNETPKPAPVTAKEHRQHPLARQHQPGLQPQPQRNQNKAPINGFDYAFLFKPMR